MFTGLIEETGAIRESVGGDGARGAGGARGDGGAALTIAARCVLTDIALGDSIAVDGVCLTVTEFGADWFRVGLAPETLRLTTLGGLAAGARVNLERALRADARLGGHLVQGHVDGVGIIRKRRLEGDSLRLEISMPEAIVHQVARKGYIAVDGASLTVTDVARGAFSIMLIAYTRTKIALAEKSVGDRVNLESDIVGKYAERLLAPHLERAASRPVSMRLSAKEPLS